MRLLAYMLRPGDLVNDGRTKREVKAIRREEHGVIVAFKSGPAQRIAATAPLSVRRDWTRRERGR
ncbi:hypothetical protein [Streptomyces sp. NPDC046261]|uniref:hypothetical protein n=1 Tax=Streptomyces sp. NPDC046261 TaxID=3157200 RepID=UPI0033E05163